jgi:hypothetical protein
LFSFRTSEKPVSRYAPGSRFALGLLLVSAGFCFTAPRAKAQEPPYQVTHPDSLEEPGNLEVAFKADEGNPKNGNRFESGTVELEYGGTAWWTTEVYLQGQTTKNDSTIFTGVRWENRFRPLLGDHFINPVLYLEYEDVSAADRSLLEITGHASIADLVIPNGVERPQVEHSLEEKLILSSNFRGWNISENFISEKDIHESDPWEFGYALGVSRALAFKASSRNCLLCRENWASGLELYGGLGDSGSFGWRATSQYLAPIVSYSVPKGPTITFSPNFGLNDNSLPVLFRFKVSYEVQQLFHGGERAR